MSLSISGILATGGWVWQALARGEGLAGLAKRWLVISKAGVVD
jgi:hypothetical protein